ncbi:MAG: hypothetical protein KDB68_05050 [Planctomycetes bacterium]|nr:hypothetical protein [Planctomycetota bacterium]
MMKVKLENLGDDAYVVMAVEKGDGSSVLLLDGRQLDLPAPRSLFSGSTPWLDLPACFPFAQENERRLERDVHAWLPLTTSLVYGQLVRRLGLAGGREQDENPASETLVELPEYAEVSNGLQALETLTEIIDVLDPLMTWALQAAQERDVDGDEAMTSPLPPLGLLPAVADVATKLGDRFARVLALSVVHVVGQEAVLLSEGCGESQDAAEHDVEQRRKRWFEVLKEWLQFLGDKNDELVPARIVLPRIIDNGRARYRGAWLPATTVRVISCQLKTNLASKKREDLISRIGMELPWMDGVLWGLKSKPANTVVMCDPYPRPLDHVHWWQTCLDGIGLKLIEAALKPEQFHQWDVLDVVVPWYRQSLAATIALAHSAEQFVGRKMLTLASKAGPETGAAPNALIADEARLISKPYVADPGEIWKVANDPTLLQDERVSTPVAEGIKYEDPSNRLGVASRNLAEDVKLGLSKMEEFRRIRETETQLVMWWRAFRPAVHADFLDQVFGHGWAWKDEVTEQQMLQQDYPPTVRFKGGWLPWVIAMRARNKRLPPNFAVPSAVDLENIGVDQQFDEEALDVMITRAGTIPDQDPYRDARKPSAQRAVRQLVLQGWYGKKAAQERALQWLAEARPETGKMWWYAYVTICTSIALARWIHPEGDKPKVRTKLVDVFRYRLDEAAGYDDTHAKSAQVWINSFLQPRQPFPA